MRLTNLTLAIAARPTNPRRPRRITLSGSPFAGKVLYGFITDRRGTKVLRRFRLGRANVCGYVSRRAIVAPKVFRYGAYRIYVNAGPRLDRPYAISEAFTIEHTL